MDRLTALAHLIGWHGPKIGITRTPVPRLSLIRGNEAGAQMPAVYEASLCLIAQGSKRVSLGEHSVTYDASRYLLVSLDLPLTGTVLNATPSEPYLCCKIDLDLTTLAELVLAETTRTSVADVSPLAVCPSDPDLVDAACRLVSLLDRPEDIGTIAPLIEREVLYRLLKGPHGDALRHIAAGDSHLRRVSRAIAWIRTNFREQLRISEVAEAAGMSVSSLHEHFRAITTMTPLQYQKRLRLQEARRLMLAEGANAGTAGFTVGYDSPSQFSREYRRLFGAPPRRDIERLQMAEGDAAVV